MTIAPLEIARKIDHTLLRPEAAAEQIDILCDEALRYGFGAVCVNPVHVRRVVKRIGGLARSGADSQPPAVVSVAGFPLGANATATKVDEARRAIDEGATEIDMVVNLGALSSGHGAAVRQEIEAVAHAVHGAVENGILKVILETAALSIERIILGCRCCAEGEADFVKTSTGFHPKGGATLEHVRLLHKHATPILVKASGGIRTAATALAMLEAGAVRLGTSSGVAIVEELRSGQLDGRQE